MGSTQDDSMEVEPGVEAKSGDAMEQDETPRIFKIHGSKIANNIICKISAEAVDGPKKVKTENRVAVLILDCSGSMGHWVQRSVNSWQMALRAQDYDENDKVIMLEFESSTRQTEHKLKDLNNLGMHCRGGTSMQGVVPKLQKLVEKYHDKTINVWCISDGGIGDQHQFKESMMTDLAPHFKSPNINVVAVRLCSGHNEPDVQAMSAVGLISSQEFKLENFQMGNDYGYGAHNNSAQDVPEGLAAIMGGMRSAEEKIVVSMEKASLLKRPGDKGEKTLDIFNQNWFMIKDEDVSETIMVDGQPITIEMYPETENLSVLEQFATKIYMRLVQEKIAGLYENAEYIEALEQLFYDLDNMSKVIEKEHEESVSEMSTTSRALQIKQKFGKQTKTIRQKIAELKNLANIDHLSGQMKSNLMRGLGAGKGDLGLARRYARTDQGKDPSQMLSDAIQKCKPALLDLKLEKDQDIREECFFSKESSLESALVAIETGVSVYEESDEITADDLLSIFGLHGLAIRHKAGNYTDPMLIGLNQGLKDTIFDVYPNVVLNQSILWYSKQMQSELKAPGFDKAITAVVPIKSWNHPAVWKLYCQETDIGAMQTSAHLRNVLTPLPKDRVAFTASTLLKMMADWSNPTEVQAKMMSVVLLTIQWKTQSEKSKEIADALMGDNPLAVFSTANNLASELAPFAHILCDPFLLAFLAEPGSHKLWRALMANTVYWTVRRSLGDEDRGDIIKKMVNLDEANFTHPLPDLEDEPEPVAIHDQWPEDKAKEFMTKNKYLYNTKLYRNMLSLAVAFKAAGNKTSPTIFNSANVSDDEVKACTVGMDLSLFGQVEVVKSILTRNETDRYSENCIGFHDTEEEARNYLKTTVRGLYRTSYDTELKLKLDRVKEAKLQEFLATFISMDFNLFATRLKSNVPNQNSKGVSEMLKMLDERKENVVDMAQKVELMVIGKFGEHTWNNGSVAR